MTTFHLVTVTRTTGIGSSGATVYTRGAEIFGWEFMERQRTIMSPGGALVLSEGTLRISEPALAYGAIVTGDSARMFRVVRVFHGRAGRDSYSLVAETGKLVIPVVIP